VDIGKSSFPPDFAESAMGYWALFQARMGLFEWARKDANPDWQTAPSCESRNLQIHFQRNLFDFHISISESMLKV
jgi:hypothetical protein